MLKIEIMEFHSINNFLRYGCGMAREFKSEDGTFHPIQKMHCQWNREWNPPLTELPVSVLYSQWYLLGRFFV